MHEKESHCRCIIKRSAAFAALSRSQLPSPLCLSYLQFHTSIASALIMSSTFRLLLKNHTCCSTPSALQPLPIKPASLLFSPTMQAKTLIAIIFSSHPGTMRRNSSTTSKCHCCNLISSPSENTFLPNNLLITLVLFLFRPFGPSSDPLLFCGFHAWRIESSRIQWSFDHCVDDNGSAFGDDGSGEEETNATFLEGEEPAPLLPLPEP